MARPKRLEPVGGPGNVFHLNPKHRAERALKDVDLPVAVVTVPAA